MLLLGALLVAGCGDREASRARKAKMAQPSRSDGALVEASLADTELDQRRRQRLIESWAGSIRDPRVLEAFRHVRRHAFVPAALRDEAYEDRPLPIGEGQTISQPWVVARMTELLAPGPEDRVLEVGTGSGYQAAILARLAREVYTIEILEPLARRAQAVLERLGVQNVHCRVGDGYAGWPAAAPFKGVIITAAVDHVPMPLVHQLEVGGRLVLPLGPAHDVQYLTRVIRTPEGVRRERFSAVRFVPMTGEAEGHKR